jgi:hypothetical protein
LNLNKGFLALQLVEPPFLFPSFSLNNNTRYKNKCGEIFQARWNTQLRSPSMVPHNTNYTNDEGWGKCTRTSRSPLWFGRINTCLPHSALSPRAMVCAPLPLYLWKWWMVAMLKLCKNLVHIFVLYAFLNLLVYIETRAWNKTLLEANAYDQI